MASPDLNVSSLQNGPSDDESVPVPIEGGLPLNAATQTLTGSSPPPQPPVSTSPSVPSSNPSCPSSDQKSDSSNDPSTECPKDLSSDISTDPSTDTSTESESSSPLSIKEQLEEIQSRPVKHLEPGQALARELVPKLAARAYHLQEDNTWCQDWIQYQRNTHPVFGVCFHHPLHPVRGPQRAIILIGSIAFGLAITNVVYLGFLGSDAAGSAINFIYNTTGTIATVQEGYTNVELQQSMVFLWTVGSFLHSSFDMLIWHMTACACFRPGGKCTNSHFFQNFGVYLSAVTVACCVFIATSVIVFRLNNDELDKDEELVKQAREETQTDTTGLKQWSEFNDVVYESADKFSFLVGYSVELAFALFIFYPLTSTMFFSGILGCGKIPILGGRPYELKKSKKKKEKDAKKKKKVQAGDEENQKEENIVWEV